MATVTRIALTRIDLEGRIDDTFGAEGVVLTDFLTATGCEARALAVDPLGRLTVAGAAQVEGSSQIALARYGLTGAPDQSFGADGRVLMLVPGSAESEAFGLSHDSQGRSLVGGIARIGGLRRWLVVRYLNDGRVDASFGKDGVVITDFANESDAEARAVRIDEVGRIVVAGTSDFRFAVARYDADGRLDTSFGSGGVVTVSFGQGIRSAGQAAAVVPVGGDPDRIVVAGSRFKDPLFLDSRFALIRLRGNGSLDTSFGGDGRITTPFPAFRSGVAAAMDTKAAGSIMLVVGFASLSSGDSRFAVAQYKSDGQLDPSFGGDGTVFFDFPAASNEAAFALTQDFGGGLIVAGSATVNGTHKFALARYKQDGTLFPSFGLNGRLVLDVPALADAEARAVVSDQQGRIVVAGTAVANS